MILSILIALLSELGTYKCASQVIIGVLGKGPNCEWMGLGLLSSDDIGVSRHNISTNQHQSPILSLATLPETHDSGRSLMCVYRIRDGNGDCTIGG